nr:MAG TPA: hypothetical protein [Bacteriophage sp.]
MPTDTLSAVSGLSHHEQVVVLNDEQVLIALVDVAEVNHCIEKFILVCSAGYIECMF